MPKKLCRMGGCKELAIDGQFYCAKHAHKKNERHRYEHEQLYHSVKWRNIRAAHLRNEPLCRQCAKEGRITAANVVDHIVEHEGNLQLFYDSNNYQSLCYSCHNRKTMTSTNAKRFK